LLDDLATARVDGTYQKVRLNLAKKQLLVTDDWEMEKLTQKQSSDLLEVLEDLYQQSSTIMISQLPVSEWYNMISNTMIADVLLDHLLHNHHRIELN